MLRLFLLLALAATAYGYGRIVGGENTDIRSYPWQVSLSYNGRHRCGGAVVAPRVVVTASHCTFGISSSPNLAIKAGSTKLKDNGERRRVVRVVEHPKYNPQNIDYDVAILFLDADLPDTEAIKLVKVVEKNWEIIDGTLSAVTGWGATTEGGSAPSKLQVVRVPYVNRPECQRKYQHYTISQRMSCWGYPQGGRDACQGDSGGPLVIYENSDAQLAGVVSWGIGCARPNYPGVYADLTNADLNDFVTKHLQQ